MTSRKIILLATSSLAVMAGAVITPALPAIEDAFPGHPHSRALVPLVLTAPALVIALLAPFAGIFADRIGRKPLLLFSLVVYAAAGSSGLWMDSLASIVGGRLLLGAAVAGTMTGSTTLLGDYSTGPERQSLLGTQAATMGFAGVAYVVLGGVLADVCWRAPFAVYLAALPLAVFSYLVLVEPKSRAANHSIHDLDQDAKTPWMVVAAIYGLALCGMILFYLIPVQMPFFLRRLTEATGTEVGLTISVSTITGSLTSLLYRRIREFFSFPTISGILFTLIGCGYLLLSLAENMVEIALCLVIAGLGLGLLLPNLTVWLTERSPEHRRGRLIGGLTTALFLGQFLSPILAQPVIAQNGYGGTWGIYATGGTLALGVGLTALLVARLWRW